MGWKVSSSEGVVAAGSAESVMAGVNILNEGGNAVDAAVATIFALNVTDHGDCSIGGEVPILIYDANSQSVKVLSGQGRAPLSQEAVDWYMKNGIPGEGDIKMAPVPSVVDSCITALQLYGTRTFKNIIGDSLSLLDAGTEVWHPKLAHTFRRMVEEEQITTGVREQKLQSVTDRFYGRHKSRNDIAEELEDDYLSKGGFLRRNDLAGHVTTIEEPVKVSYRGHTVYKCGPWTQGPFLCQALRLLEGFDLTALGHLSADYIHTIVEVIKLAMADRDYYYGDPDFVDVPLDILLSDEYNNMRRNLIDMETASIQARPGDPYNMQPIKEISSFRPGIGGTTTCVVADRWGNVVSATPSANVPESPRDGGKSGVTFSNRLRMLNTTPGHPNCIEVGKRPRSTLTPTIILKGEKPIMAISVAGGDLQDQVSLNLIINAIDFNMLPHQCVTVPRFATAHHQDSFDPNPDREETFKSAGSVMMKDNFDNDVKQALLLRGHTLEIAKSAIGRPVMLTIDQEEGTIYAAGDPEGNRHAASMGD
jgi:gamma-glutamyltranspeptidase/glutathione hydrolase